MSKKFAKGIWFNDPSPNAPEFVSGSLSIKKEELEEWLKSEDADVDGVYLKLDILRQKEDQTKHSITVNDWKKP